MVNTLTNKVYAIYIRVEPCGTVDNKISLLV